MNIFFKSKFEGQMNNIKNWLLEAFNNSLSIILEKKALKFNCFREKSEKVRVEKEKFILKILKIGI